MSTDPMLASMSTLKAIAERLSRSPAVTRFDVGEEREAWTLAHSFADMEGSFRKIYDEILPRLIDANIADSDIDDLLLDIGEELRHILYHIQDPKFYRYLHGSE